MRAFADRLAAGGVAPTTLRDDSGTVAADLGGRPHYAAVGRAANAAAQVDSEVGERVGSAAVAGADEGRSVRDDSGQGTALMRVPAQG